MEMDKLTLAAVLLLTLSVFRSCFNVQADPVDVICRPDFGQYTLNSTFARNVKQVLQNLVSNTAISGFNNTSFGKGKDQVYGQAFCRGDVGHNDCQDCIKSARSEILSNCNASDAVIWNEKCQLYYSIRDMSTDTEYGGQYPPSNSNEKNASNPGKFSSYLQYLLTNVSYEAAHSTSRFSTGEIIYSKKQTIYALVQCAMEMSSDECNTCLSGAMGDLERCCSMKEGGMVVGKHCNVRHQVHPFYNGFSAYYLTYPTQNGSRKKWVIVIVASVLGLILIALAGSFVIFIRREKKNDDKGTMEKLYYDLVTPVGVTINQAGDLVGSDELPFMDLNIIKVATDDFSTKNKLGQGGFGAVFQGVLPDGKEIAVKRLSRKSWQGLEEFKNEIKLIAKLQHKNLVGLVGCAFEGDEKLLVYEYVPNKSLDMFIFNEERRSLLNWKTCHAIIDAIARGLVYLHEDSRLRIIHRDLKPSNVLLDSEMVAKISDFGMARIFGENQNTANTKRVVGTYGYMAPEYAMGGLFSVKSDVFSFGVIVFEILSGKRNSGFYLTGLAQTLLAYAWRLWNEGRGLELVDSSLVDSGSADEILRCIHIGLLCVQEDPADRPTMSEIVTLFNNKTWEPPQPNQPAFSISRVVPGPDQSSEDTSFSVNELTVSAIFAR